MRCEQISTLRDGTQLIVRSLERQDAAAAIWIMRKTAGETDFLLREPQECGATLSQEETFILQAADSPKEALLGAFIGGELVGMANVSMVSPRFRTRHRAQLGVLVVRLHWGKGIATALMRCCIELAKAAGYEQLELEVVHNNARAVSLYTRLGFEIIARTPRAIRYADGQTADMLHMMLMLCGAEAAKTSL